MSKNREFKKAKARERERRKAQGSFDGRFAPKVHKVKTKKKPKYKHKLIDPDDLD